MRRSTRFLLLSSYLWYLGEGMLGPLFAVFSQQVGGDILGITGAWTTYLIATGILSILVGKFSDKIGHAKLLVLGYALNALFTFSYLLVHSQMSLLFVQIGLGLATALATPTWDALFSKHGNESQNGFMWGLDTGGSKIVLGIAIMIGGFILVHWSFNMLFVIMGCVQVAATLAILPILHETVSTKKQS